MKKAGSSRSKFSGEERLRETSSMIKKLFEGARKPNIIDKDTIEEARHSVAEEAKNEFNVIINQVFGVELRQGEEVDVVKNTHEKASDNEKNEEKITSEHLSYFSEFKREAEGKKEDETNIVIKQQLDAILSELRNLKDSSDELENVFQDVVIDTPPEKPGIYHLTFFEGFLKLVIKMKNKVEDGVTYAKLFRSRKKERSYHSMAQKKGTSFTLHHDRAVATQTG